MAYEMKPGQGSAWPNEKKEKDWHADFSGKVMLPDGKTHWLEVKPQELGWEDLVPGEDWQRGGVQG